MEMERDRKNSPQPHIMGVSDEFTLVKGITARQMS